MILSVNILTWNTFDTLLSTLKVLKNDLSHIEHEVIIVDNGSTDGCEVVATIKNDENLGISVGKNQGVDGSKGKFIMLLDGDLVPVPNSIPLLLQQIQTYSDIDAVGFRGNKWTDEKNKAEEYCHTLFDCKPENSHCLFYGMFDRSVFDSCRLDESYGPGYGYEDLDFWRQMNRAGIQQWFCGVNTHGGRYYHKINSSIRNMGRSEYIRTSKERHNFYKRKWALC